MGIETVRQEVEKYCMDKRIKEVEPEYIFNAKPTLKYIFSIPFNFSYDKHLGPVQAISCSPFHRKIFLTCSIDGSVKMFDASERRNIISFEPGHNEYLMDVCFSPFRPAVFATIGTKGNIYIYDLTISKLSPTHTIDVTFEESKDVIQHGGVKLSFNPKQRLFLAVGFIGGITKIYKLNYTLSNPKKNEITALNELLDTSNKL
jgi:WD40 repeat protein